MAAKSAPVPRPSDADEEDDAEPEMRGSDSPRENRQPSPIDEEAAHDGDDDDEEEDSSKSGDEEGRNGAASATDHRVCGGIILPESSVSSFLILFFFLSSSSSSSSSPLCFSSPSHLYFLPISSPPPNFRHPVSIG